MIKTIYENIKTIKIKKSLSDWNLFLILAEKEIKKLTN